MGSFKSLFDFGSGGHHDGDVVVYGRQEFLVGSVPPLLSPFSVGQGFDKPQGYEGKGIKGKGQGQDFHTLVKPLPLTLVKGFARVFSRVIQG